MSLFFRGGSAAPIYGTIYIYIYIYLNIHRYLLTLTLITQLNIVFLQIRSLFQAKLW